MRPMSDQPAPAPSELPEHVARQSRGAGTATPPNTSSPGAAAGRRTESRWGIWGIPETEVHLLPDDVAGQDVVELGCGTAVRLGVAGATRRPTRSASTTRRPSSRPRGRSRREFGLEFPLHPRQRRDARRSRTRASTARSASTARRSGRIPTPGSPRPPASCGRAAGSCFLTNAPLILTLARTSRRTVPPARRLLRPVFRDAPDRSGRTTPRSSSTCRTASGSTCCTTAGFEVERLVELQPRRRTRTTRYTHIASLEWARKWPSEEAWLARKRRREAREHGRRRRLPPRDGRAGGYSPMTLQRKPIEMNTPLNRAIRPSRRTASSSPGGARAAGRRRRRPPSRRTAGRRTTCRSGR